MYRNNLCIRRTIYPDFSDQKLGVCIIYGNYIINFFQPHASLVYSERDNWNLVISVV